MKDETIKLIYELTESGKIQWQRTWYGPFKAEGEGYCLTLDHRENYCYLRSCGYLIACLTDFKLSRLIEQKLKEKNNKPTIQELENKRLHAVLSEMNK